MYSAAYLGGLFALVDLVVDSDIFTPLLLNQEVFGFPRLWAVLEHEDGTVVVDHEPAETDNILESRISIKLNATHLVQHFQLGP